MNTIIELFQYRGDSNYIGEQLSQKEHMIGAAMIAEKLGFDNNIIVAALLHDIGHLLFENEPMGDLGVKDHEIIGSKFIRNLGFNNTVCDLVLNHVNAKRYLCSVDKNYFNNLSEASKQTLNYQGGIMNEKEISSFKSSPNFEMYLNLRRVDELAKDKNMNIVDIEYFRDHCEKCLI